MKKGRWPTLLKRKSGKCDFALSERQVNHDGIEAPS